MIHPGSTILRKFGLSVILALSVLTVINATLVDDPTCEVAPPSLPHEITPSEPHVNNDAALEAYIERLSYHEHLSRIQPFSASTSTRSPRALDFSTSTRGSSSLSPGADTTSGRHIGIPTPPREHSSPVPSPRAPQPRPIPGGGVRGASPRAGHRPAPVPPVEASTRLPPSTGTVSLDEPSPHIHSTLPIQPPAAEGTTLHTETPSASRPSIAPSPSRNATSTAEPGAVSTDPLPPGWDDKPEEPKLPDFNMRDFLLPRITRPDTDTPILNNNKPIERLKVNNTAIEEALRRGERTDGR